MTATSRTLFEKLWARHVITEREDGEALLWVDRHFVHEGSHHAFRKVDERGTVLAAPELTFGVADHYVPTQGRTHIRNPEIAGMVARLSDNAARYGFRLFGLQDPAQGIVHVVGPELGLTLPGLMIVCGDSHTSTHGAFGAFAFGIGASEVAHVLMTQTLWQRRPKTMRITVKNRLEPYISAKDLALHIIAQIGTNGAQGHALEYTGEAIAALSMEGRMTLCNMSIEAGARCALIAPDSVTFAFVRDRQYSPKGSAFEQALVDWQTLNSDRDALFDREISIDAAEVEPTVTWGISPEQALPISGSVPVLSDRSTAAVQDALDYMALEQGQSLESIVIDQVFIGSCTNARIEDLRAAAEVLLHRKAIVPGLVSPGSSMVKRQAEAEGLDQVFLAAGLTWAESGCSLCVAMNGDALQPGIRCASTTNRNFRGRQGIGVRTHLMSPAMVAAAAVAGHLIDVRHLLRSGG